MTETSKEIVLSGGARVMIRKFSAGDFLSLPSIPDIHSDIPEAERTPEMTAERESAKAELAIKFNRIALLSIGAVREGAKRWRIVDKGLDEKQPNELTLLEFAGTSEAREIVKAVLEFNSMTIETKEAAKEAVAPFPGEPAATGAAGSAGASIPGPSDGNPQAPA